LNGAVLAAALVLVVLWRPGHALLAPAVPGSASVPQIHAVQGWHEVAPFSEWRPHYLKPSAERTFTFTRGNAQIGLYLGYYFNQSRDGELITFGNALAGPGRWSASAGEPVNAPLAHGSVTVQTARLAGGGEPLEVWRWYWIDRRVTGSPTMAKLYLALNRLTGRGDDSAVVILYTPRGGDGDTPSDRLRDFTGVMWPQIDAALGAARQRAASPQGQR
jgi:EpsI family protein